MNEACSRERQSSDHRYWDAIMYKNIVAHREEHYVLDQFYKHNPGTNSSVVQKIQLQAKG